MGWTHVVLLMSEWPRGPLGVAAHEITAILDVLLFLPFFFQFSRGLSDCLEHAELGEDSRAKQFKQDALLWVLAELTTQLGRKVQHRWYPVPSLTLRLGEPKGPHNAVIPRRRDVGLRAPIFCLSPPCPDMSTNWSPALTEL
ncbi:Dna Mismatch Repair Protein Msh3 [Manis pentadactyla]|nr:Dna Mismatch Repair Protein Msh3 [Manis pentadactyla]